MKNLSNVKIFSIAFVMIFALQSCGSSSDDPVDPEATQYNIESILTKFVGDGLSYSVNGNSVTFTTKNLPDHKSSIC